MGGRRGGRQAGGEGGRRRGRPPSGVEVRVECKAAVVGEKGGEGDEVGLLAVPVLLQHVAGGGREEGGAGARSGAVSVGADRGLRLLAPAQLQGQSDGLQRLGRRQTHERTAAAAPSAAASSEQKALLALLCRRRCLLPVLLVLSPTSNASVRPPRTSALVFLEVAAEDEGVRGGESALSAAESLARRVLQLLVQVEVVLALAAVGAAVAVEGPLARVHAHMLDELVGRFGQVAALLALVVVAQAVAPHVRLQRGLVRPQSLADAAAVLHLTVRLQMALHGRWTIGGVDAKRAPG